jgi:hypothetical protein
MTFVSHGQGIVNRNNCSGIPMWLDKANQEKDFG